MRAPGPDVRLSCGQPKNGHLDVLKFLLQEGARIDLKSTHSGKTALMRAAQYGHAQIVRLLIEKGADVDSRSTGSGKTALIRACQHGHYEIAKLLLERGAHVNPIDKSGKTALDYCIERDSQDLVDLLNRWGGASAVGRLNLAHEADYGILANT